MSAYDTIEDLEVHRKARAELAEIKQAEANALGRGINTGRLDVWIDNIVNVIHAMRRDNRHSEAAWWGKHLADLLARRAEVAAGANPHAEISMAEGVFDLDRLSLRNAIQDDTRRGTAGAYSEATLKATRRNCIKCFG